MTLEIDRLIGGVVRELTTRERDGATAHVLVATRRYDAPRAELWDALTRAERIPRWFMPIAGDLRLGGRYQLEGNAGGEIVACETATRLAVTWEMRGEVSWLTVTLADAPDGGTSLRLEHVAHVPEEFWRQYGPGAVGVGWDQALLGLHWHLATGGTPADPAAAAAWVASDEGRAFVHGSSDAWCAASIAVGTDPELARAAAARTAGFYTGS
jgi:uncharacterized protein YndB with AHSA1/START domain